jgi:hypothetical protein
MQQLPPFPEEPATPSEPAQPSQPGQPTEAPNEAPSYAPDIDVPSPASPGTEQPATPISPIG